MVVVKPLQEVATLENLALTDEIKRTVSLPPQKPLARRFENGDHLREMEGLSYEETGDHGLPCGNGEIPHLPGEGSNR